MELFMVLIVAGGFFTGACLEILLNFLFAPASRRGKVSPLRWKKITAKLSSAILFAAEKHKHQKRKNDGSSYICHPLDVMDILVKAGVQDEDVLIAAVLHDTVEDTQTTLEEIRELFGENVAWLVASVTDDKSLPKVERKKLQIEHAKTASLGMALIKMADKISNLRTLDTEPPKGWSQPQIDGYFHWSYAVVKHLWDRNLFLKEQLLDIFAEHDGFSVGTLEDDLEAYYTSLEEPSVVEEKVHQMTPEQKKVVLVQSYVENYYRISASSQVLAGERFLFYLALDEIVAAGVLDEAGKASPLSQEEIELLRKHDLRYIGGLSQPYNRKIEENATKLRSWKGESFKVASKED